MKLIHFRYRNELHWGALHQHEAVSLGAADDRDLPRSGRAIIENWSQFSNRPAGDSYSLDQITRLAPIPDPQKIICVGRNYTDHAREMGSSVQELPVIFNKFPTTVAHPDSNIPLPTISQQVDFEAELVVVIGREGKDISVKKSMEHVFGYCCGNDLSARDWQKGRPGGQWLLGKTFDGFAPLGPWLVTVEELDPHDLEISLELNGVEMQRANTRDLVFKIDYLIAHLSKFCTLMPGDVLMTGTPAGVGAGRQPPVFLKPGDETTVRISGIGELTNRFQPAELP